MKKIVNFIKPYLKYIIIAIFASVGCTAVNIFLNDLIKQGINMTVSRNYQSIVYIIIQCVFVAVLGFICNYAMVYFNGYYSNSILADIREGVSEHLKDVSIEYIEKSNYGDLVTRMSMDLDMIRSFMENYLKDCLYVPVLIVGFSIYLLIQDTQLYFITMIPLFILVPLSVKLMAPIKFSQREYSLKLGNTSQNIYEICEGIVTVKAYNMENTASEKYRDDQMECLRIASKNDRRQYMVEPISYLIMYLPLALCLVIGGYKVLDGRLSLGTLIAFSSMLGLLIDPMVRGYQMYVNSKAAFVSMERVLELLDVPDEDAGIADLNRDISRSDVIYKIEDVSYAYEETLVLNHIDIDIKTGSKVALVGASGSGKSTLLKLLFKQYQDYSGSIYLAGEEMRDVSAKSIRRHIALIAQDSYLFPMSIMENIKMAKPGTNDEEVIEASKAANAHEFIMELPEGYHTYVGENGSLVSGGQRQRIAIARAILKDADIILLDEPTSALDYESEKVIVDTIYKLFARKTIVTVAHRIPTVVNYDEIIVFDKGEMIEKGTHEELLNNHGLYERLWLPFITNGGDSNE